jgi:hypothetical protein
MGEMTWYEALELDEGSIEKGYLRWPSTASFTSPPVSLCVAHRQSIVVSFFSCE